MANARVRPFSVFGNGKKVGQIFQANFKLMSGDEPQFGDGGLLGYSDGATQSSLSCSAIQPAGKNMDYDLAGALLQKQDIEISLGSIGSNIYSVTMRTLTAEFDTEQKSGKLEGKFDFGGGEPSRS
jgi:hypothetical protein